MGMFFIFGGKPVFRERSVMFQFSLLASYFDRIKWEDGKKYYLYGEVWTDYATETLSLTFLCIALILAVAIAGIGIFVRLKKTESFPSFAKYATVIALTFAVTVISAMLAIKFAKISEKGYAEAEGMLLELVPPLVLGIVIVLGVIASYLSSFFSKKTFKITLWTSLGAIICALVATIVCLIVFYSKNIKGDGYYTDPEYGNLNQIALYVSAVAIILVSVGVAFLTDRKKTPFDSRCIALAGICIALSFALSYIKLFSMPQGGSITLASLLPIMLFAYIYGPKKGLFAGFIYGAMQAMQDPYIVHPAQFLLDYPVAFAMVGFTGIFANIKALDKLPQIKFTLGAIITGSLRYVCHLFSGVFAFGAYALDAETSNFWAYSAAYNSFVFIDILIVIVLGAVILSSKNFNRQIALYKSPAKKTEQPAEQTTEQ